MSDDLVSGRLRGIIQTSGMVRKEVFQTLRQPQLLLLLVVGPFVILVIFGFGYDEDQMALRTRFVGPEGSIYQSAVDEHVELLSDYIVPMGWSTDLVGARNDLVRGDIDLIVSFPTDAPERLSSGEQAVISIYHDKIDPLQRTAVEIASRLAVGEVNATILEVMVDRGLDGMRPVTVHLDDAAELAEDLESAAARNDSQGVDEAHAALTASLAGADIAISASETVIDELSVDDETVSRAEIDELRDEIQDVRAAADRYVDEVGSDTSPPPAQLARQVADLAAAADVVVNVPPQVIVRPFASGVEQISDEWTSPTDFFAPATIALLLAHIGVTFAAMSVVADRRLGVFEIYRVAPLGAVHVVASKYLAYVVVGGLVGAALIAAVVFGLGVPMGGSVLWVAGVVVGLSLASIGLGLIVAAAARSDSQAVQYAMLLLLAGLFFGGFLLEITSFEPAVRLLARALPVTFGITMLHDIMLRGIDPATSDVVGLGALVVVYGLIASVVTRRQLQAR